MIKKKFKNRDDLLHKAHKPKKKKLSPFYKISLSVLVIASMVLGYFLVLVSTSPKSIPFITKKIEAELQNKVDKDLTIADSLISFTRYGTVKIQIIDFRFSYKDLNQSKTEEFKAENIEAELSLFDLIRLKIRPTKVKIIRPEIALNNVLQSSGEPSNQKAESVISFIESLSKIRLDDFPIENFDVEDAEISFQDQGIIKKILLKKSQIRSSFKGGVLYISSSNNVSFASIDRDVAFKVNCQLQAMQSTKCDLILENFVVNSIAKLNPSLEQLNQINASVNFSSSFLIKGGKLKNVAFKLNSDSGDFSFLEFFSKKLQFSNLEILGDYDHEIGVLKLSQIKSDILSDKESSNGNAHLDMSLLVSGVNNVENRKLDFFISLKDVPNNELSKFWPITLHENGIRDWVISHIKEGVVKNAYAKFSLLKNNKETVLEDINAQVAFAGFSLNYSNYFPKITDISGIANFSIKDMKILLNGGDVLNSKISEGVVAIDDFNDPKLFLKISGKSSGNSADSLKHADYKSEFAKYLGKYLNGDSQNSFDIRIPLSDEISLKKSYIAVNSNITNLRNEFLRGDVVINSKKDFLSNNFATEINLTKSELKVKDFDLEKKMNDESALILGVVIGDQNKILLKNISLWKKEKIFNKRTKKISEDFAKISGNAEFEIAPFLLTWIDLQNINFGQNNHYQISYRADKNSSTDKISIKAKQINLAPFIENKALFATSSSTSKSKNITASADNIRILRGKYLKNLKLDLSCISGFCSKISARASYEKKNFFDIRTFKDSASSEILLKGRITDAGYLAEGLGISNVVSLGDIKISAKTFVKNKEQVFAGDLKIDEGITIYENASVKRLAKNTLFLQIKDKIFSSEKTTFDSVKIDFEINKNLLEIKSLIANNYKIGITAKGKINFKDDAYNIKGMIVPGFIVNNLFGIGNIPLIGGVISGVLTGGEGGGVFGIRYEYVKNKGDKEGNFTTNKISSFVPTTIKNLFDLI
jgi:hypothetical protein